MRRVLFLVPFLAACSDQFYVGQQTCDTDYLDWAGGLTQHLLHGKDGDFSYDPPGTLIDDVTGGYDFVSGNFGWVTTYNPQHWRVNDTIAGYGYAKTDGDLDVRYWVDSVDVLGATTSYEVREKRAGCAVTRHTSYSESESWHYGTFVDGGYTYRDESDYEGTPWVTEGTMNSDFSYSETTDFTQPGFDYYSTNAGDGAGNSREDFTETQNAVDYEGYFESFVDGSEHDHYTVDGNGTWDYTIDFAGNGTGTYVEGSTTCELTFTEGDCAYDCGGGETGSC